ncbi:MAG: GNAT family N-acetyltransferase [Nitrospirae bacterium]|nr:GNAT family N-acetyltransferase [Nitrospirota bacterium]MBF0618483.1 GNAT family N-acetyltransferase [Nitrospirota bacterium]
MNDYSFIRLNLNYKLKPFDCGEDDLNDFFINQSKEHLKQLLAVTYILESDRETIAFYSVLNDKIDRTKRISKRFPDKKRYTTFPAVKIGRLGVHKDYQRQGYGTLLFDYIKDSFADNNKTGCRFITVDAYNNPNIINFYEKNGFFYLSAQDKDERTRLLCCDLMDYVNYG